MANTNRKNGAQKTNSKNGNVTKRRPYAKTKAQIQKEQKVRAEVFVWIFVAVSLFLLLSNFSLCGALGNILRHVMLGIFGTVGYVFPIVLVIISGLVYFNRFSGRLTGKIIGVALLFIDFSLLFHFIAYGKKQLKISVLYQTAAHGGFGGGFIGGCIGRFLCSVMDISGAYIVAIIVLIICIVVLTERSLMDTIRDKGQSAYHNVKGAAEHRREESEWEQDRNVKEKHASKRERKIGVDFEGIALDTTSAQAGQDSKQDMHEIHIEGVEDSQNGSQVSLGRVEPWMEVEISKKIENEGQVPVSLKKGLKYKKPPYTLLNNSPRRTGGTTRTDLMATANKLKQVLANFGVHVDITNVSRGPSVTRYELQPELGTKVSRIKGLADDIKLNMAAPDIRIEAPIPGKAAVGIEIPNDKREPVYLKELLNSPDLKNHKSKLAFPAGKDLAGHVVVADIVKMPHMLIAGTTGSGKSVFTNSILMSILYRSTPEEVRLIVIDPKVVEFQVYNKIPHLLHDVVTDPKKAAGILNWAVAEMTTRYKQFAGIGAKDIQGYNEKIDQRSASSLDEELRKMPQILIIIDELADLMMVAAKEVEEAICRLAQLARAAGIHMIIATQRPSVDVITGLIKANIPSRVALTVASGTDSRTILDMNGAEKLLGNGDMLFYPAGYVQPIRLQGAYVSEKEIVDTVRYIIANGGEAEYDTSIDAITTDAQEVLGGSSDERDPIFEAAGRLCIEKNKGSTSMIQRQFKVGFNRAARVMEQLCDAGVVGQEEVNKPRKVIMTMEEFESVL